MCGACMVRSGKNTFFVLQFMAGCLTKKCVFYLLCILWLSSKMFISIEHKAINCNTRECSFDVVSCFFPPQCCICFYTVLGVSSTVHLMPQEITFLKFPSVCCCWGFFSHVNSRGCREFSSFQQTHSFWFGDDVANLQKLLFFLYNDLK